MSAGSGIHRAGLLALTLVGCGGHGAAVRGDASAGGGLACLPATPDPGSLDLVREMEGSFRLTLVTDSAVPGDAGALWRAASGRLELVPNRSAEAPLRGWTDVDLGVVGARAHGDPASEDPSAPGALVFVSPAGPGPGGAPAVTVRLGSWANRGDVTLFDGTFAALYVQAIDPGGFSGRWASGASGREVTGRFCADRTGS